MFVFVYDISVTVGEDLEIERVHKLKSPTLSVTIVPRRIQVEWSHTLMSRSPKKRARAAVYVGTFLVVMQIILNKINILIIQV